VGPYAPQNRGGELVIGGNVIALLILALLVVLLFGGLGIFVAKLFFWGLILALAIVIVGGLLGAAT
jgi:hypothetical protein